MPPPSAPPASLPAVVPTSGGLAAVAPALGHPGLAMGSSNLAAVRVPSAAPPTGGAGLPPTWSARSPAVAPWVTPLPPAAVAPSVLSHTDPPAEDALARAVGISNAAFTTAAPGSSGAGSAPPPLRPYLPLFLLARAVRWELRRFPPVVSPLRAERREKLMVATFSRHLLRAHPIRWMPAKSFLSCPRYLLPGHPHRSSPCQLLRSACMFATSPASQRRLTS